jgi:hypothetical protein
MEGFANANHGPIQKSSCTKAQTLQEDLPTLRSKKRPNISEMQKMPQQKPSLEKERDRKVDFRTLSVKES